MPWLANYWLLAHLYLGNHDTLGALIDGLSKFPAKATRQLAKEIKSFLDGGELFGVSHDEVDELIQTGRKNCPETHRESASVQKTTPAMSQAEVKKRLKAREDPEKLIQSYPDDVALLPQSWDLHGSLL